MPILLRSGTVSPGVIAGTAKRAAMRNGVLSTSLVSGVTVDGPDKNIYTPLTTAEFSALGLTTPTYLFPCQESSGALNTTIGSYTLTVNGTGHLYQQSVSGWSRKAVGSTDDTSTCAWRSTAGTGPDPSSLSAAWIGYVYIPSGPASIRSFFNLKGSTPQVIARVFANGLFQINVNTVTTDGAYSYLDGNVHPIVLSYNRTASSVELLTDKERIVGTWDATVNDGNKGLGGVTGNNTCIYRFLWVAAFSGAAAEQDWKSYLQKLNWTLSY